MPRSFRPYVAKQGSQCSRRKQQLQRERAVAPRIFLEPIAVPRNHGCNNRGARKEIPGCMIFAEGNICCGGRTRHDRVSGYVEKIATRQRDDG